MLILFRNRYFVPQLQKWLILKIRNCLECDLVKRNFTPTHPHTLRIPVEHLFSTWSIDLCGKLIPSTEEYLYFYLATEHLTGFTIAQPVISPTSQAFIVCTHQKTSVLL